MPETTTMVEEFAGDGATTATADSDDFSWSPPPQKPWMVGYRLGDDSLLTVDAPARRLRWEHPTKGTRTSRRIPLDRWTTVGVTFPGVGYASMTVYLHAQGADRRDPRRLGAARPGRLVPTPLEHLARHHPRPRQGRDRPSREPRMTFDELLATLERELLDHAECVHPGAPRSVSRDPVVPVWVVLDRLAAHADDFR